MQRYNKYLEYAREMGEKREKMGKNGKKVRDVIHAGLTSRAQDKEEEDVRFESARTGDR